MISGIFKVWSAEFPSNKVTGMGKYMNKVKLENAKKAIGEFCITSNLNINLLNSNKLIKDVQLSKKLLKVG